MRQKEVIQAVKSQLFLEAHNQKAEVFNQNQDQILAHEVVQLKRVLLVDQKVAVALEVVRQEEVLQKAVPQANQEGAAVEVQELDNHIIL